MTNDYRFPSGILNEIEGPLRRKPRDCYCIVPVLFTVVVLLAIMYFMIGHFVDIQKARADKAIQEDSNFYASFCDQAKIDHMDTGTTESAALKNLCG